MDFTLLLVGVIATAIWWTGAAFSYWRKRALAAVAFFLAGLAAIVFTITTAGGHVAGWLVNAASASRAVIAALFVSSLVLNQPRGKRPDRWLP